MARAYRNGRRTDGAWRLTTTLLFMLMASLQGLRGLAHQPDMAQFVAETSTTLQALRTENAALRASLGQAQADLQAAQRVSDQEKASATYAMEQLYVSFEQQREEDRRALEKQRVAYQQQVDELQTTVTRLKADSLKIGKAAATWATLRCARQSDQHTAELNASCEQRLLRQRSAYDGQFRDMQAQLQLQQTDCVKQLDWLQARWVSRLGDVQQRPAEYLLRQPLERGARHEGQQLERLVYSYFEQLEQQSTRCDQQLEAQRSVCEKRIRQLPAEYQHQLAAYKSQCRQQLEQQSADCDQQVDAQRSECRQVSAGYQRQLVECKSYCEHQLEQLDESHAREVAELRKRHELHLAELDVPSSWKVQEGRRPEGYMGDEEGYMGGEEDQLTHETKTAETWFESWVKAKAWLWEKDNTATH